MSRGTVIVTGASSFMGMHLASYFAGAGYHVIAAHTKLLENYQDIQRARLEKLKGKVRFILLDFKDSLSVKEILTREQPCLWVHHAGFATNYASYDYDFQESIVVNAMPLFHLYPVLKETGAAVILTGSSTEYGVSDTANIEDELCAPNTPYGLSKLMETLLAKQLSERYEVPTRVARLYIPFGSLDNPQKLLSQVALALREKKPVSLSPCDQKRDFIFAEDVCHAYLLLGEDINKRRGFDIFNVCSGESLRLREFLLEIAGILGADPALLRFGAIARRPGEPEISFGENLKAKKLLGWNPRPLKEALREYLDAPAC